MGASLSTAQPEDAQDGTDLPDPATFDMNQGTQ
jgi:hypothetical protein